MTGTAQPTQHDRKLRLGRQRAIILAEVGPLRPFLLRQQQNAPLIVVAELHLLDNVAEQLELAAGQVVSGEPVHALKHSGTSFLVVSADTQTVVRGKGGNWQTFCRICGQQTLSSDRGKVRNCADRDSTYRSLAGSTRPDYSVSKRPKAPSGRLAWNWLRRAKRASYGEPEGVRWPMRWSRKASTMSLRCRARAISMCSTACTRCVRSCI